MSGHNQTVFNYWPVMLTTYPLVKGVYIEELLASQKKIKNNVGNHTLEVSHQDCNNGTKLFLMEE